LRSGIEDGLPHYAHIRIPTCLLRTRRSDSVCLTMAAVYLIRSAHIQKSPGSQKGLEREEGSLQIHYSGQTKKLWVAAKMTSMVLATWVNVRQGVKEQWHYVDFRPEKRSTSFGTPRPTFGAGPRPAYIPPEPRNNESIYRPRTL
jgi:hypothetical protein